MYDVDSSNDLLSTYKKNLAILRGQAAQFGTLVPLTVQNEIDWHLNKISSLEKEIDAIVANGNDIQIVMSEEETMDPTPQQTSNQSLQQRLSEVQREVADFRTIVLVKLAQIEVEVRQIRDEQNEMKDRKTNPNAIAIVSVVVGIFMVILMLAVLVSVSGGV